MKLRIEQLNYHRNGITGIPFYAVILRDPDAGRMVGLVFPTESHVAVLQLDKLAVGDIAFGSNSWRGDQYESVLRKAIRHSEQEQQP